MQIIRLLPYLPATDSHIAIGVQSQSLHEMPSFGRHICAERYSYLAIILIEGRLSFTATTARLY